MNGGLIGLAVCFVLYGFYICAFFIVSAIRSDVGSLVLYPAFFTGHAYSILSGFMSDTTPFCPNIEPVCTYWTAQSGCVQQVMQPTSSCRSAVEISLFFARTLGLFTVYYLIGAILGAAIQFVKSKKKK
jgi:hypothetical protein